MEFDANLVPPALGILGLLIVVVIYQWIKKQPGGSGAVQKIGQQIHIGSIVFMKREYKMLSIFALVLLVLLYIFLGSASAKWGGGRRCSAPPPGIQRIARWLRRSVTSPFSSPSGLTAVGMSLYSRSAMMAVDT